jgi:hypothetical protein
MERTFAARDELWGAIQRGVASIGAFEAAVAGLVSILSPGRALGADQAQRMCGRSVEDALRLLDAGRHLALERVDLGRLVDEQVQLLVVARVRTRIGGCGRAGDVPQVVDGGEREKASKADEEEEARYGDGERE